MNPLIKKILLAFFFLIITSLQGQVVSDIVSQDKAREEVNDWGNFYTYYSGESHGAKDLLNGVAVIKPGMEIHPPHTHAEEEFLMVIEGKGTWHLNGAEMEANSGDILYAKPWDIHGIKNTGDKPLKFVVWKWNSKGVETPGESVPETSSDQEKKN